MNNIENNQIPKHLGIIPDGNRRWAKENSFLPWKGHVAGAENLIELTKIAFEEGVEYITFWGFSTENWSRDKKEVEMIMDLFLKFLKENKKFFLENKISFRHFGRKDRLSENLLKEIDALEKETVNFTFHNFAVALDYGGRDEIERAILKVKTDVNLSFEKCLDTVGFPDVDLIIRTAGEKRVSGFLPWQSVYAEFYFSDLFFPDFKKDDLMLALKEFSGRKRRFGK